MPLAVPLRIMPDYMRIYYAITLPYLVLHHEIIILAPTCAYSVRYYTSSLVLRRELRTLAPTCALPSYIYALAIPRDYFIHYMHRIHSMLTFYA